MEFSTDDSWEPEPCQSSDLFCEEGIEGHIGNTSDEFFDSQHAHQQSSRFSHGYRPLKRKCNTSDGYGGTSSIRMPSHAKPEYTETGSADSYDEFSKIKRPKQGMHGNQVNRLTLLLLYL